MEKLEKYGVQEINAVEMRDVDGGNAPKKGGKFKGLGLVGLLLWVEENWAELKCGAISGWNAYDKDHPKK